MAIITTITQTENPIEGLIEYLTKFSTELEVFRNGAGKFSTIRTSLLEYLKNIPSAAITKSHLPQLLGNILSELKQKSKAPTTELTKIEAAIRTLIRSFDETDRDSILLNNCFDQLLINSKELVVFLNTGREKNTLSKLTQLVFLFGTTQFSNFYILLQILASYSTEFDKCRETVKEAMRGIRRPAIQPDKNKFDICDYLQKISIEFNKTSNCIRQLKTSLEYISEYLNYNDTVFSGIHIQSSLLLFKETISAIIIELGHSYDTNSKLSMEVEQNLEVTALTMLLQAKISEFYDKFGIILNADFFQVNAHVLELETETMKISTTISELRKDHVDKKGSCIAADLQMIPKLLTHESHSELDALLKCRNTIWSYMDMLCACYVTAKMAEQIGEFHIKRPSLYLPNTDDMTYQKITHDGRSQPIAERPIESLSSDGSFPMPPTAGTSKPLFPQPPQNFSDLQPAPVSNNGSLPKTEKEINPTTKQGGERPSPVLAQTKTDVQQRPRAGSTPPARPLRSMSTQQPNTIQRQPSPNKLKQTSARSAAPTPATTPAPTTASRPIAQTPAAPTTATHTPAATHKSTGPAKLPTDMLSKFEKGEQIPGSPSGASAASHSRMYRPASASLMVKKTSSASGEVTTTQKTSRP